MSYVECKIMAFLVLESCHIYIVLFVDQVCHCYEIGVQKCLCIFNVNFIFLNSIIICFICKGTADCDKCSRILDQVCGDDGQSWPNQCEAECRHISVQCRGPCPCSEPGMYSGFHNLK